MAKFRAAGYVRVSTDRQMTEGLSIQDQKAQIRRYADAKDIEIVEFFEEAHTATEESRPQLQEMLFRARDPAHPYDYIIVYHTSRFARNNIERALTEKQLRRHDVAVLSVTLDVSGSEAQIDFIKTVIGGIDELHSRQIGENTVRCMKENARQGFFNGSKPPFGYDAISTDQKSRSGFKKKLVVNAEEAAVVRRIFVLSAKGDNGRLLGVKSIASKLSKEGISRRGRKWTLQEVHRTLRNTTYIGNYLTFRRNAKERKDHPKSEWILSNVPSIVDEDLFAEVQRTLGDRRISNPAAKAEQSRALLTGIAKCGLCGCPMMIVSGKSGQYRYYRCAGKQKTDVSECRCPNVPQKQLEEAVLKSVVDCLLTPATIVEAMGRVNDWAASKRQSAQQNVMLLRRQHGAIQEKLSRLYEGVAEGKLALDGHLGGMIQDLERRLKAVEAEASDAEGQRELPLRKISQDHAIAFGEHARKVLCDAEDPASRIYFRSLVSQIVIKPDGVQIGAKNFDVTATASRWDGKSPLESVPSAVTKWRA